MKQGVMILKGSVRKYASKKNKRGYLWMYVVDMGKDPATGKRKQKRKRGFERKEDAERALADFISSFNKGDYIEPSKVTVEQFLNDWIEGKKLHIKEITYNTYKNHIDNHIIPHIGKIELSQLLPQHISDLHNKLHEKGLSGTSIQDVHKVLRNALGQAVKWGMIHKNVAVMVDRPKAKKKEIQIWTIEQANQFLQVAKKNTRYYIAFLLALSTGMRQGEILGLRWKDIDFEEGVIKVVQTLDHQGKKIHSETKSKAGQRTVAIDSWTLEALKSYKAKVAQEKLIAGSSYQDHGLVVCTALGTPVTPRNLLRAFYSAIKKANVPKITFHELRHTHASILLKQGVHVKVVSERLGHANIRITLDTYSHLMPNMQKETAEKFADVFYVTKT